MRVPCGAIKGLPNTSSISKSELVGFSPDGSEAAWVGDAHWPVSRPPPAGEQLKLLHNNKQWRGGPVEWGWIRDLGIGFSTGHKADDHSQANKWSDCEVLDNSVPAMTKVSVKKYEIPCRLYWCLVIFIHKGQELKLESWSRHLILCNTLDWLKQPTTELWLSANYASFHCLGNVCFENALKWDSLWWTCQVCHLVIIPLYESAFHLRSFFCALFQNQLISSHRSPLKQSRRISP